MCTQDNAVQNIQKLIRTLGFDQYTILNNLTKSAEKHWAYTEYANSLSINNNDSSKIYIIQSPKDRQINTHIHMPQPSPIHTKSVRTHTYTHTQTQCAHTHTHTHTHMCTHTHIHTHTSNTTMHTACLISAS